MTNADIVRTAFAGLTEENLSVLLDLVDQIQPSPAEPSEPR